jgi:hypothetical protein
MWYARFSRRQPPRHARRGPRPGLIRAFLPIGLTPNDPMGGLGGTARAPYLRPVVCFGVSPIGTMAFMSAMRWLGALLMKEGGLTNRISLRLLRPDAPFAGPRLAAGRFADVTPIDKKRTFWRTETALHGADGAPLATASIVFHGGADYSARQMEYFRPRTPPEIFRRMFPNYAR